MTSYGLDADLAARRAAKYDHELEKEVTDWIETITGNKKGDQEFGDWLKDGLVLCKLVNDIKPGTIKKTNESKMPFKQMENITYFMNAARQLGVPENSLFGTPDLFEAKNIGSVVNCINSFGGAVQANVPEFTGPKLGVEMSVDSKDKKRDSKLLTDQSAGYSTKQELERPTDGAIIRGSPRPSITKTGSPGTSPRPALEKASSPGTSPRPDAPKASSPAKIPSPRPAAAASVSPAKPPEAPANPSSPKANYGLDADLKAKQDAKYDVGLEKEVQEWVEAITGESRGDQSMHEWLKNGKVLCNLANKVKPGSVAKVNTMSAPFKQMENISFFMNAARDMGVPENSLFGVPDLYEEKNMGSVLNCLYSYGGAIQVALPTFGGPQLGVALTHESKDKKREGGLLTDQSAGYSKNMDVQRPDYPEIHRH